MATVCTISISTTTALLFSSSVVPVPRLKRYSKERVLPSLSARRCPSLNAVTSSRICSRAVSPLSVRASLYLVQKVTAQELNKILTSERTFSVVVDFYATWCGPCILLAQELEQLVVEYGNRVKFLKIDTDEEYDVAVDMQIRGLPTLVFISKDAEKDALRAEGLLPLNEIRNIIDSL
eukprot:c22856_g2_i1 orf=45-578(+)